MGRRRVNKELDGLFITFAISLGFLAFSFARIAGDAGSAALEPGIIKIALDQSIWGTRLGVSLAWFVGALIALHSLIALVSWVLARLTLVAWPHSSTSQRAFAVFWFALVVIWILAANARWYPRSSLGAPYDGLVTFEVAGISAFLVLTLGLLAAIGAVVATAAARSLKGIPRSKIAWVAGTACLASGVALPAIDVLGDSESSADSDRPHVILIGLDSLRTDFVQQETAWTPSIDAFLDQSVVFSDAYTPLARTFPAWVSIVSGRHPHTTGAIVNLLPREFIDEGPTLPAVLGENGYRTVYAIDEVRFSNLDKSYGFDEMLAPAMGSADFLLGFFADTPLANLFVNIPPGEWLFPYAYANRAAAHTYHPGTFVNRIESAVEFDAPTLLAVHFTLAHWPYVWADSPPVEIDSAGEQPGDSDALIRSQYELAVRRLDEQFRNLMAMLEDKGALDNAVVVVLSDHGESLGEPSPILEQDLSLDPNLTTSALFGHGTHVLSGDQYHVVLGMRSYGNRAIDAEPGTVVDLPVSLEDIAPTMLDVFELDHGLSFDGRSLVPYMAGDSALPADAADRVRFLETEFNPPGFSPGMAVTASAFTSAAEKYEIDPATDRVLIRADFVNEMLAKRQYAVEQSGEILATVPATGNYRQQYLLHFDPETAQPHWLDQPPSPVDDPVRFDLWESLGQRFEQVRTRPVVPKPEWDSQTLPADLR
jgi:arylsulfatase A-like enzyme